MPTRIRLFGDTQRADQYRFQAYRKHLADALMLRGFQNLPIYRHQARLPEGGMVDIVCHHNFNEIAIYMPPLEQREEEPVQPRQQFLFSASFTSTSGDEEPIHQIIPRGLTQVEKSSFTGDFEYMIFGRDGFLYASIANRTKKIDPASMAEIAEFYCGETDSGDSLYGGIPPRLAMGKDRYLYTGAQRIDNQNTIVHKVDPSTMQIVGKYEADRGRVESLDFGNNYLYAGLRSGYIHKLDPGDMSAVKSTAQSGDVLVILVGKDSYLYSGTLDNYVHKFDPVDMGFVGSYSGHTDSVYSLAMNGDEDLFSGSKDSEIHKMDTSGLTFVQSYTQLSGVINDMVVDDEDYLYAGSSSSEIHRINSKDMSRNATYDKHSVDVHALAITDYPVRPS